MKNTENQSINHHKYTLQDLKEMQSWDLDRKIAVSLTRIAEFYNVYPNKIYILS